MCVCGGFSLADYNKLKKGKKWQQHTRDLVRLQNARNIFFFLLHGDLELISILKNKMKKKKTTTEKKYKEKKQPEWHTSLNDKISFSSIKTILFTGLPCLASP